MYTVSRNTTAITEDVILKAIEYNETLRPFYDEDLNFYKGNHPILERDLKGSKINNKVVVNHAKLITRRATGYFMGSPVEYQVPEPETKEKKVLGFIRTKETTSYNIDAVKEAYDEQRISNLDYLLSKWNSKCGKNYELVYIKKGTNKLRSVRLDPRNCVVAYDNSVEHNKLFAVTYDAPKKDEYENIFVYDAVLKKEYKYNPKTKKLVSVGNEVKHKIGYIPIIEFTNNDDEEGDFRGVITLINAYNILASDRVNDKEQLVNAILALKGFTLSSKQASRLKESRILGGIPKDGDAQYLIKNLTEDQITILKDDLKSDIYEMVGVPNMTDENFAGNITGVALRYKLIDFEQLASEKEIFFEKGLLERFEIYNNYLHKVDGIPIVPTHKVKIIFHRNLPQNDLEMAQTLTYLDGKVSNKTGVAQISFVEDAGKEAEQVKLEKEESSNVESPNFGSENPTPNNNNQQEQGKNQNQNQPQSKSSK